MTGLSTSKEKTPMMPQTEIPMYSGKGVYFLPEGPPDGGSGGGGKRPGSKPPKKGTPKKSGGKAKKGAKRR